MIAYKFLGAGRTGPFTGFEWPEHEWVEAEPEMCRSGIHACEAHDLPYWLNRELWEIELERPTREQRKLVAPRGRLRRHLDAWDEETQERFAGSCVERLRSLAASSEAASEYVEDAERYVALGLAAMVAFVGARAAEIASGRAAYEAERTEQAAWLVERLELAHPR